MYRCFGRQKVNYLESIHTHGVATSSDAGSSHICMPEFQHHQHFQENSGKEGEGTMSELG